MNMPLLQHRVGNWVQSRFGIDVLKNAKERAARVVEESVELAQAEAMTESDVHRIVSAVYAKPDGYAPQEAAGVGVTLLAWSECRMLNLDQLIESEIRRIESLPADHFRKRQQAKADAGIAMSPAAAELMKLAGDPY